MFEKLFSVLFLFFRTVYLCELEFLEGLKALIEIDRGMGLRTIYFLLINREYFRYHNINTGISPNTP